MNYITKERREAYVELIEILENMDTYYKEKVPLNVIKYFKLNASKEYKFHIDVLKPLEEQKIKDTTKNILAALNLKFWCETEEEKQKWKKIYAENERKYEEELNRKYDIEKIFEKRRNRSLEKNKNDTIEDVPILDIVEHEETLLEKIINKIKRFLRRIK